MTKASEWHDNRPCDRLNPRYKTMYYAVVVAIWVPGTVAIYFASSMRIDGPFPIAFALTFGIGFATFMVAVLLAAESRFPLTVQFSPTELVWTTSKGMTHRFPYSDVQMIWPSRSGTDWRDGACMRFYVTLPGRTRMSRWIISLTPDNKQRLEEAMKQSP